MSDALTRAHELRAELPTSDKADFRAQIHEKGGSLRPDNPLWDIVLESLDDYDFMIDDLVAIRPSAAEQLARNRPEMAARVAERLARHLTEGDYGSRTWDSLNTHLNWIHSVLEGLDAVGRYDLFEDVAFGYCEAVAHWDRYRHNDTLTRWLGRLAGPAGDAMARAIHHSGQVDYFRSMAERQRFTNAALTALLEQ